MNALVIYLAYGVGLLATALPGQILWLPVGGWVTWGLGGIAAIVLPRWWRTGPRPTIWLLAGLVSLLAAMHFQLRLPQPRADDISRWLPNDDRLPAPVFVIRGQVSSSPRMTRSQRGQFWLTVRQVRVKTAQGAAGEPAGATGQLYVTAPLLTITGLRPGQPLSLTGHLYRPSPASNPGGFDFQKYLAQQGGFAGLQAESVERETPAYSGWRSWPWAIRQRIIRAQVKGLGSPAGPLVSAMTLGNRVVDLPRDVQDLFAQAGLAHALAASGFQVSLILGVVLSLTRRCSPKIQVAAGLTGLLVFLGLTGISPAVLRAVVMGAAALVALASDRKIKPIGALVLSATVLLAMNPLWIWDVSFQLSFLATLGLLVTVPWVSRGLDWLPATIATLLAVPIAAYLWTLPLLLSLFGVISPYSIVVNAITTPLISIVSLGSVFSALLALVYPGLGTISAALLYYPAMALVTIAEWGNRLPGNHLAVGRINLGQVILLYALLGLVWSLTELRQSQKQQQKLLPQSVIAKLSLPTVGQVGWGAIVLGLCLILLPAWYKSQHQVQLTTLATGNDPVLVVQEHGRNGVINLGKEKTVELTVLPFLQSQGINHLDWAISLKPLTENDWPLLLKQLPIRRFYILEDPLKRATSGVETQVIGQILAEVQRRVTAYHQLAVHESIQLGQISLTVLATEIIRLSLPNSAMPWRTWLCIGQPTIASQRDLLMAQQLPPTQVLWWGGTDLWQTLLEAAQPRMAIAAARQVSMAMQATLGPIPLRWTGRDGAIQWTPEQGFQALLTDLE